MSDLTPICRVGEKSFKSGLFCTLCLTHGLRDDSLGILLRKFGLAIWNWTRRPQYKSVKFHFFRHPSTTTNEVCPKTHLACKASSYSIVKRQKQGEKAKSRMKDEENPSTVATKAPYKTQKTDSRLSVNHRVDQILAAVEDENDDASSSSSGSEEASCYSSCSSCGSFQSGSSHDEDSELNW